MQDLVRTLFLFSCVIFIAYAGVHFGVLVADYYHNGRLVFAQVVSCKPRSVEQTLLQAARESYQSIRYLPETDQIKIRVEFWVENPKRRAL